MKKIYLIIIILTILIACILLVIKYKKKYPEINISSIKYMHFGYSTGTMIYSNVYYDITYENEKYIATIKPNNIPNDKELKTEISKDYITRIEDVLKKYNVEKWDNFNKSDNNVLDGNSFSLSVTFINNKKINASGYMMYPNNYREVANELDRIFMEIYNGEK